MKFAPSLDRSASQLEVCRFTLVPADIRARLRQTELDTLYNKTNRRDAEDILQLKNATYRTSVFSGAPHGFAIRPNVSIAVQAYAKQASYEQAVSWFKAWL